MDMMELSTSMLREMEVINLCGGEKLGYPCDFRFDADSCRITALVIPTTSGFFDCFKRKEDIVIPWCNIKCIGEDAILVEMSREELNGCRCRCKRR